MQLYVIGPARTGGKVFAVGLAASAGDELVGLQQTAPEPLSIHAAHNLKPGWDQLAATIATSKLRGYHVGRGWYRVPRHMALSAAGEAATRSGGSYKPPPPPDFGKAIAYLRKSVFGTNQTVFGHIAGGVSPSAVSRWEAGEAEPAASAIYNLRSYAAAAGLPWEDRWIFEPPVADLTGG